MRPKKHSYPDYYEYYIELVKEDKMLAALNSSWKEIKKFVSGIPKEKENYAYAEGKWTVKQVLSHLIDTERIFAYRALRFARKDPQKVLSFEEDHYTAEAELDSRTLADLMEEFDTVRKATLSLYKSFSEATLLNSGATAIGDATVVSIGYMICGHASHHLNVVKTRYLI